jgi:hypothetical protein
MHVATGAAGGYYRFYNRQGQVALFLQFLLQAKFLPDAGHHNRQYS